MGTSPKKRPPDARLLPNPRLDALNLVYRSAHSRACRSAEKRFRLQQDVELIRRILLARPGNCQIRALGRLQANDQYSQAGTRCRRSWRHRYGTTPLTQELSYDLSGVLGCVILPCRRLTKEVYQELQSITRKAVWARRHRSPNPSAVGQIHYLRIKSFDHDIAIVANVTERVAYYIPPHLAGAGCPTIVFACVKMLQMLAGQPDRLALILFFDGHVKGIKVHTYSGAADVFGQPHSLLCQVDQIRLESIEVFQGNGHAFALSRAGDLSQSHNGPL